MSLIASKRTATASLSSMCVRRITSQDAARLSEYQRLRAAIFFHQFGWEVLIDEEGREHDHYDQREDSSIGIYCVYGVHGEIEYLLGGLRIFELRSWKDSMVTNEFHTVGMIPDAALAQLESQYDCHELLELTRLCTQRKGWYTPPSIPTRFSCATARDLTYAAVYHVAAKTDRWKALGLADTRYLRVMKRSHFVFQEIYVQDRGVRSGFALTVIDLLATVNAIHAAGELAKAERMMALCPEIIWPAL